MDFSKYRFTYNAAAYFITVEKYPEGLIQEIARNDIEGIKAICFMLEVLTTQGDVVRRSLGYEKGEVIKEAEAMALLKPNDVAKARALILNAIQRGMSGTAEDKEVDEVLLEIQKKKETL